MSETMTGAANWQATLDLDELKTGGMSVWKQDGQQIVLCRTEEDEVFALDNRCPHEGYPLNTGDLNGCALTCCWHNWKFDVRSGACTMGEESVRSFPVRVVDGTVEVDLAEPDPSAAWPDLLKSFDEGLRKHQVARSVRDGVRLLQKGFDPQRLLACIALYDARHGEYGSTHATPIAADAGRLLERYTNLKAMYPIAVAIDMCGDANRLRPARSRPDAIPGGDLDGLRKAVEAEQVPRALGLLRGAFDAGVALPEIDRWMFTLISDHFLNFGHDLIYLTKVQELLQRLVPQAGDRELIEEIYGGLLYSICTGTREDSLPYMQGYMTRFAEFETQQAQAWAPARTGPGNPALAEWVRTAALDGSLKDAVQRLTEALACGTSLEQLARALVSAAATRLLRFNVALDTDPSVAETWLWATHRLTFACAARLAVERMDDPRAVHFLLQSLAFTHSGRGMDLPPDERSEALAQPMELDEVLQAIGAQDCSRALAGTLHHLDDPSRRQALREALEDLCLSDSLVRPIVVVHAIKTLVVAFEEYEVAADSPGRALPVLATVRMLSSPIQERRIREAVQRSIEWVGEGKMPRKLTQ